MSNNRGFAGGRYGKFGHLNILKLDHDSYCTNYGKHDRVVAFCPKGGVLECRVDHLWGLGKPTPEQVLKVAKKRNGGYQRGKFVFVRLENEGTESSHYYFKEVV